jgi:CubicO group peptidase (beta-lactamase class C family)
MKRPVIPMLLAATVTGMPANAVSQPAVSTDLAERLERLAAEFDRNRVELHVPGAILAIVRGEEVLFTRAFGVADLEKKIPVTPDTRFFIGSSTKAFTATLAAMLVAEGRMRWDDPIETYLPEFKLAVQGKDPNDRATLRDLLSHRTGFTRMSVLEDNVMLSSEEILRRAPSAEPFAPFRQRFLYNNVHYVAAGLASAAVAGTSWNALLKARIFDPLGMPATRSTVREAWADPRTARGYWWDEAARRLRPVTPETLGGSIDGIGPAGAISSTAHDMTSWLRFLLRRGVQGGKALVDPATLQTTWTQQIPIGPSIGYGMGWFVRDWQGQRLIEHGGAIIGYSAEVALLPDSNIGFVVLTNTLSTLPSIATQLVPRYLLGELPPAATEVVDLGPYLGRYRADFASFSNEIFTVSERNGRLVLDIPSQLESPLNPPRADGSRSLLMADQLAVSFDRDRTGKVAGLRFRSGSAEFEVPKEGVIPTPELPAGELRKYVGRYADPGGSTEFTILIRNRGLAIRLPTNASFDLLPPDATGRWLARANVGLGVGFDTSAAGAVSAMTFYPPGAAPGMRLERVTLPLPTVAEIMKLRRIPAATGTTTIRTTGTVRYPQSAVEGRFTSFAAGDDRLRLDLDLDGSVRTRRTLNRGRGSLAMSFAPSGELVGKQLAQMRLGHPAVLFGDWRKYYDAVRVLRAGQLGGRKIYVVQLESAGLPPLLVSLDAETGDVLQTQQTVWYGHAGALPTTTTYSDYREVGGMRMAHHYIETTEITGRAIYEVERVEVGVELDADVFALQSRDPW